MNSGYETVDRIRRSWRAAKPNPASNPAWANTHMDVGVLLAEIELLRGSLKLADAAVAARDQTIKDIGFQLGMAEEGLANYAQENAELRRCLDGGVDCAEEKLRLRAELDALKRTREQERDYADVCYALQRATEKLQELAEECAECNGEGIIKPDVAWAETGSQAECQACHDIRLVIAVCSQERPRKAVEGDI